MMPLIKRVATLLIVCLIIVGFSSVAEEKDSSVDLQQRPPGQYGLGCIPTRPGLYPLIPPALSSARLPLSVDLREGLPPAGDQRGQNSCVGWAVAYGYKTFQEVQEHQWDPVDPDHQFSPSYVYNQRPTSNCLRDNGMSIPSAMDILVEQGCVPISVFPYADDDTCTQPDESQWAIAAEYKVSSFAALFVGQGTANIQNLKAYLAGGDVFVLAFPAYANFFDPSCEELLIGEPGLEEAYYGGHAVLVVGYDDTIGGFNILNSYGPGWKCDGYAYLSYAFVQHYAWEAWTMQDITNSNPPAATPEATLTRILTATAVPPSRQTLEATATYSPELTATVERNHTPTDTPTSTPVPTDTPFPGVTPTATLAGAETPTPTPSPNPLPRPWHERVCSSGLSMPMAIVGVGVVRRWTRRRSHD